MRNKARQRGATLGAQLRRERERLFVGRAGERDRFDRIVRGDTPTRIVVVSGPAGIGKSLLTQHLLAAARKRDIPVTEFDAQQLPETTPAALQASIAGQIEAFDPDAPVNVLGIDNAERIAAMESWLRRRLPDLLPGGTVLILAGRWQPPTDWRADPALGAVLEHWELTPLRREETDDYLKRRGLNTAQRTSIIDFAHGHPLAMALAANQLLRTGEQDLRPDKSGDLIQGLIDWLLSDIDKTDRHAGLEAAATLHFVNEPVLQAMLPGADAGQVYRWLAAQPYMEQRERGLLMHELVRTVVIADLRRRNLPRHHRLIRRAAGYYMTDLEQLGPEALHETLADWAYTVRWEPYMRHYYDMAPQTHYLDRARPDERDALAAIVARQEGDTAREWFLYWLGRQPDGLSVVRDKTARPAGLLLTLIFDRDEVNAGHSDPAVHRYLDYFKHHAPLDKDEHVLLARFIMAADTYQQTGPVFTQLEMKVNSLAFLPGLVYFAVVCDRHKDWQSSAEHANFRALPGGDFETEQRALQIRGVDLKAEPPLIWIRNTVERTLGGGGESTQPMPAAMDRHAFADSVLKAMRDFHDSQALAANPLFRSRLLRHDSQSGRARTEDLRRLIRETAHSLEQVRPHKHLPAILEYNYFEENGKQITAAAALNISESTFRRRLREAEQRLIERLWNREIGATSDDES